MFGLYGSLRHDSDLEPLNWCSFPCWSDQRQLVAEAVVWKLHFSKICEQMFVSVILIYIPACLRCLNDICECM